MEMVDLAACKVSCVIFQCNAIEFGEQSLLTSAEEGMKYQMRKWMEKIEKVSSRKSRVDESKRC